MSLRKWLARIAPIYPGEGKVVLLCLAVNFLAVAGIMFGRNARDSLFLVYFGPQYLPFMYFANAVFLVLTSLIYTTLVDRVDRGKFLGGISVIFVIGLLVSWVIVRGHPRWFFPVLYIEAQVLWYFVLMQFWTFVGDLFDTRQAKRIYPLLAVGALTGMIGVGVGSKSIVHSLGTENLLLVWAGLTVLATLIGSVAFRRYRIVKETPNLNEAVAQAHTKASEWQKIKHGLEEVGREPLLRSMAGYILLLWTVYAVVDFCFNKTMHEKYPDPNDLTTFFGRFIGVQGFLCLVVQVFLTRAVIARLGLGRTINFHPAFLLAGTSWMSLRYGYASVLTTKLGDAGMLYTFSDSSYQLLYNPIAPDRRARVRGFIEGYIRPLSLAAAGGLILVGNNYLKPFHIGGTTIVTGQQLSWGAVILAAVWLGFALTAKKGYIRALLNNLQADSPALRLAAANALGKLQDPAGLTLISQTLQSAEPERVVKAALFLGEFGSEQAIVTLAALLGHPDARVRATVAAVLGRRAGAKYRDPIASLLDDPDARVRANSIEALAAGSNGLATDRIRPLLQDPSKRVRVNALLALAAHEGVPATTTWLPWVEELAQGDAESRATAIFALGHLPSDASVRLLTKLLQDPDLTLCTEAATALGQIGTAGVIGGLIEALSGRAVLRQVARRSLAAVLARCDSSSVQELVRTALESPRPEIRSELADVLGRLNHPQVTPTLITLLKDPEWRVRWKVLKSFEHRARSAPLPPEARAPLFEYAGSELAALREGLACSRVLFPGGRGDPHSAPSDHSAGTHHGVPPHQNEPVSATSPPPAGRLPQPAEHLLDLALEEDRVKIEERVFHMLGILCGREQMQAIFTKLQSGDARLRADALEALDNLAPKEIGRQLLEVLEPAPAPTTALKPETPDLKSQVLQTLAHHSKPWVRACTAYYLAECPPPPPPEAGRTLLKSLLADRDHVVRETALYAGWLAFRVDWNGELQAAVESSDATLRLVAQLLIAARDSQLGTEPAETRQPPIPNPAGQAQALRAQAGDSAESRVPNPERKAAMLLTVEKVLFLKSAPLFSTLDSEELAALADIALEKEFAPGEVIFEEGQPAHHLYFLTHGKVEVFHRDNSGEYPIATLGEEECFGEMAILNDETRSASVRALEPTQVLKIDRDSFRELITERPQISFAIFKILSNRLRNIDLEIEHVGSFDSARHHT